MPGRRELRQGGTGAHRRAERPALRPTAVHTAGLSGVQNGVSARGHQRLTASLAIPSTASRQAATPRVYPWPAAGWVDIGLGSNIEKAPWSGRHRTLRCGASSTVPDGPDSSAAHIADGARRSICGSGRRSWHGPPWTTMSSAAVCGPATLALGAPRMSPARGALSVTVAESRSSLSPPSRFPPAGHDAQGTQSSV